MGVVESLLVWRVPSGIQQEMSQPVLQSLSLLFQPKFWWNILELIVLVRLNFNKFGKLIGSYQLIKLMKNIQVMSCQKKLYFLISSLQLNSLNRKTNHIWMINLDKFSYNKNQVLEELVADSMMKVYKNLNIKMELSQVSNFLKFKNIFVVSNLHRMISIKKL